MRAGHLKCLERLVEKIETVWRAGATPDEMDELFALFLAFYAYCRDYSGVRVRDCLTRAALLPPSESPWARIKSSRLDSAYMVFLNLDVPAFIEIAEGFRTRLSDFDPAIYSTRPGKTPYVDYDDICALALHWFSSASSQLSLQCIFGLTPGRCSELLRLGRRVLLDVLLAHPDAQVCWPSEEEMRENFALIADDATHPGSRGIPPLQSLPFAFVDGTLFRIPKPASETEQRAYFSGKAHMHCVNCILVYDPHGCVIWMSMNNYGSKHDFGLSAGLIHLLSSPATPEWAGLIADTGFRSVLTSKLFITAHTQRCAMPADPAQYEDAVYADWWITYKRQAAEWGQRALKSLSPRCSTRLPVGAHERAHMLRTLVHFHNFRTRRIGKNQIKTVYQAALDRRNEELAALDVGEAALDSAPVGLHMALDAVDEHEAEEEAEEGGEEWEEEEEEHDFV
jgi:hypothetical protein